ncbi:hypothetical protein KR074_001713, partial [Drosophila pseudoananassae]
MNRLNVRKNGRKCIIASCQGSYRDSSHSIPIRLFSFPSDDRNLKKWVELCQLDDTFNRRTARICNRHFKSKYIGKSRLRSNAVTTLNLCDNSLLRPNSTVPCEQFEFCDDGAEEPIGTYINPIGRKEFLNRVGSPSNLETPNLETLPQLEDFCSNCQKREENERFYRKKNYEMFLELKKYKEKMQKMRRAFVLKKNSSRRKGMRNSRRSTLNLFNIINKLPHVSDEAKTLCKMLLKKSNSHNSAEKVIAQNINFYSSRTYEYMRDVLKLKLPAKSTLCRWALFKNMTPGFQPDFLEYL